MRLDADGQSVELIAETDEELELLQAMTRCLAVGGWIRAIPKDGEGVQLNFDGDPSRN